MLGRIKSKDSTANSVLLTADADSWEVPIDFTRIEQGGPIPTLWARHMIRELEEAHGAPTRGSDQKRRQQDQKAIRLLELGSRYGLLSSATSYVAIEERTDSEKTTQQSVLRQIPITISKLLFGSSHVTVNDTMRLGTPSFLRRSTSTFNTRAIARCLSSDWSPPPTSASWACQSDDETSFLSDFSMSEMDDSTASTATIPDSERVFELLMTQQANGSFPFSPQLRHWLGDRVKKVEAAIAIEGEALVATAVVVMLLQTEAPDHADEWGPAVTKAQRWLSTNGKQLDVAALLDSNIVPLTGE